MKNLLSLALSACVMCSQIYGGNLDWTNPPTVLSNVNNNAADHQVVIDNAGNVVTAWIENGSVKSRSRLVNGSWSATSSLSSSNSSLLKLVSDKNGNATAIWQEGTTIKTATKTLLGNWTSSSSLSSSSASSPILSVDVNGNLIAAWIRNGDIETTAKIFGSNWQAITRVNADTPANPIIAMNGSRAVLVWQGGSAGNKAIYTTTKSISGTWSSGSIISEPEFQADKPFVAVDANGNAIALWYSYAMSGTNYINVSVKTATRSAATGKWSSIQALSLPGIRNPSTLQARVSFDTIGNAIALWSNSYDGESFNLESAVNPVNGTWSSPVNLVDANPYAFAADLSTTSFGDVLGLYMFYNGSALLIQSVESDFNGFLNNFWSVPVTVSFGSNNAYPKIAASLAGNEIHAAAVWLNYNGTNNLLTSSIGSKTLVLPPSNLQVAQSSQNFGAFVDYYNTLTWNASSDSNVKGYAIFRNGAFIAQVEADVLNYVDNNRTQNGSVKYSVTSFDSEQTQSTTVSVNFP